MKSNGSSAEKGTCAAEFAFLCETPLHLLNAINFVSNDTEHSRGRSDIYIYHCFKNSEAISARLKKSGMACHVYDIKRYNEQVDARTKFRMLYRLFFPKRALAKHIIGTIDFSRKKYKHLVMFSYTMRGRNLLGTFRGLDHIMIEDGIGAYFGNQLKDYVTGYYALLDQYVFRGRYEFAPSRMYVYHPELCDNEITDNILKLPEFDRDNAAFDEALKIYDYRQNDAYKARRLVYFTQPLEQIPGGYMPESEREINAVIINAGMKDELIMRVHPRQSDIDLFGCEADGINNFWELESSNSITDTHILVSAFSTAAFTPKYINSVEPYVIFTYKLQFKVTEGAFWENIEMFIGKFGELYEDKAKILVPESYGELSDMLKSIYNDTKER